MPQQTPEYLLSELPTIEHLKLLNWQHLEGDRFIPEMTDRESFKEVILTDRLKKAIKRINLDENGQQWLEDSQIDTAVTILTRVTGNSLLEINQQVSGLFWEGTVTEGKDGKNTTIHYIDFENPENNDFLAINQFRVDPPWLTGDKGYIVPDIVLFVNGIPLVVIECKSPKLNNPLEQAITDLLKYSNQRHSNTPEGAEKLFYYNLLMVAVSQHQAVVGAVGGTHSDYTPWKDTYPTPETEIANQLGVTGLNNRQKLIAGMLKPSHLLNILQNFTLFTREQTKITKIIPYYQQYRAVHKTIDRLEKNPTRSQHGDTDQRGGIIWHTQGAGKSLTMVYLVKKIRTTPALRRFKIVVITDRTDLEKQLAESAVLTGEPMQKAKNVRQLERLLAQEGSGLVFGMIQKFRGDTDTEEENSNNNQISISNNLNPSEDILVFIDEAHRSHTNTLHLNLSQALPNCAKIGFTGTPIVKSAKKTSSQIFGSYIDQYTIKDSQEDGVTLPIYYEGIEARAKVKQGDDLDQIFDLIFQDKSEAEKAVIKQKYANKNQVLEATEIIEAKAKDMLKHYISHILPNGFKAQIAVSSRSASIKYYEALNKAQQQLIEELEKRATILKEIDMSSIETLDETTQFLALAYQHLDTIKRLEFAPVISGSKDDPPSWQKWTNESNQETHRNRFKKPLDQDGLAFLIVKSMLLTGFNAPLEQVLYLDRTIKEHELLQAIARVNRTHAKKGYGLVVDYYGVDIASALAMYDINDLELALKDIRDELPKLQDKHQRVINLFKEHNCDYNNLQETLNLFIDQGEKFRVIFAEYLKDFLNSLDEILPRPEAKPYLKDAKQFGLIRKSVADLYRDEQLNLVDAKEKVNALIDQYITIQGINPHIPPIDILSPEFDRKVEEYQNPKTQAAAMEHAARAYISDNYNDDPSYYKKLSEKLEEIVEQLKENWENQVIALQDLVQDIKKGRQEDNTGLNPVTERPFLSLIEQYSIVELNQQIQATKEIVKLIKDEIRIVHFWRNQIKQRDLRLTLIKYIDDRDLVPFEQQEKLADELVQLARHKHIYLTN
ncbi:type I restriction endonuclease subunit R [Geminocystis sp. CENA526]|uniref:type I restriction endonuclease subunit R n=1 Tax=Geminocystis sp. CENA526 TaxID=1355871 RepID=UPI003D6F5126